MATVYFLISARRRHWGSSFLRGEQLCMLCNWTLGTGRLDFRVTYNPDAIAGSVIFITKPFLTEPDVATPARLAAMRARGNILFADFLDAAAAPEQVEAMDTLIASSHGQHRHLRAVFPHKRVVHLTHHVDTRVGHPPVAAGDFACAYFGDPRNLAIAEDIADHVRVIAATDPRDQDWIDQLPKYNAHYVVRKRPPAGTFKPFLKGFIAAHCGAVVFASGSEREARHYLGDDYPFYCPTADGPTWEEFDAFRQQFGSAAWRRALDIMADVRARSSPLHIRRELRRLFLPSLAAA